MSPKVLFMFARGPLPGQGVDLGRWISGRARRREYWVYVALVMAIAFAVGRAPSRVVELALLVIAICAQIRSLHDFNANGWWIAVAAIGQLAFLLALSIVMSEDTAELAYVGLSIGVMAAIGAVPGTPGENRFGPPPGRGYWSGR